MERIRWGIVGLGQIAYERFLPGLLRVPNADLVSVADTSPARRALFAQACPTAVVHPSLEEMLAKSTLDVLYVALPTGLHREAVERAAGASVHVLCEKPLSATLEDAEAMAAACSRAGVRLMTAYMSRFGDVYREALRILQGQSLGELTFAEAHFAYDARRAYPPGSAGAWRWTDPIGGGPMLDIGIYLVFALRELLGSRLRVKATSQTDALQPAFPQPDTHTALFTTESGVPGTLTAAFTHDEVRIALYGAEGKIVLSDLFSQSATGKLWAQTRGGTFQMDAVEGGYADDEHYFREADHLTQALRTGAPHRPNADEVLDDMRVLHALRP